MADTDRARDWQTGVKDKVQDPLEKVNKKLGFQQCTSEYHYFLKMHSVNGMNANVVEKRGKSRKIQSKLNKID